MNIAHLCASPEHGKYLSLDLGGTNFRALLVDFKKGSNPNSRLHHKIYTIPPEIMRGSGEEVRIFQNLLKVTMKHMYSVGLLFLCVCLVV